MKDAPHHTEFKWFVEKFVNCLTNHRDNYQEPEEEQRTSSDIPRIIFNRAFEHLEFEINQFVGMIKDDIEKGFLDFKEQLAESFSEDFAKDLWMKFEDGHDIYPPAKMICYFKDSDSYEIGTAIENGEEGTSFRFQDGSVRDPDYVQWLYPFK